MKSKLIYFKTDGKVYMRHDFYMRDVLVVKPIEKMQNDIVGYDEEGQPIYEEKLHKIFNREIEKQETEPCIGYDKAKFDEIIIADAATIPTYDKGTQDLYIENGAVVAKTNDSKVKANARKALQSTIAQKKTLLHKYREDVEQVDLFGMERADYEEKKVACKNLVEELRTLEKQLTSG